MNLDLHNWHTEKEENEEKIRTTCLDYVFLQIINTMDQINEAGIEAEKI